MRSTFSGFEFVTRGDTFVGVSLGFDFCAEHEWGIGDIWHSYGVAGVPKKNLVGPDVYKVTELPENQLHFIRRANEDVVFLLHLPYSRLWKKQPVQRSLELPLKKGRNSILFVVDFRKRGLRGMRCEIDRVGRP